MTTRLGSTSSFTQHTFVHLAAIDILSRHPASTVDFLASILPPPATDFETHPLDRTLTLYYLNTAEHFTLSIPPQHVSHLLFAPAAPYLHPSQPTSHPHPPSPTPTTTALLEASHALTLTALSSPSSAHLLPIHLPQYIPLLFSAFPAALSAQQFTLAFTTLARLAGAPQPQSYRARNQDAGEEMLEVLLDMLISRIQLGVATGTSASTRPSAGAGVEPSQHPLLHTLIATLPLVPAALLASYLDTTAALIGALPPGPGQEEARQRLWQVLAGGEVDVERSAVAVAWWGTRGGRERVLGLADRAEEARL